MKNEVDVNLQMVMRNVPYKKRKLPQELNKFCADLEIRSEKLRRAISKNGSWTEIGYWLDGQKINENRKIYLDRKGKYNLNIDWSEVNRKYIQDTRYYHADGKWYDLPSYIKVMFGELWLEEGLTNPRVRMGENEADVSFSNQKCRDAIYWDQMQDCVLMDMGGSKDLGTSNAASKLLKFADDVLFLEMSMTKKECIGLWNLPFFESEQTGTRCDRRGVYRNEKGYYLCERCGTVFLDMIGRVRKVK